MLDTTEAGATSADGGSGTVHGEAPPPSLTDSDAAHGGATVSGSRAGVSLEGATPRTGLEGNEATVSGGFEDSAGGTNAGGSGDGGGSAAGPT